jgi:radical SAM protein with 4Fe4S-binding SPASM domain
MIEFASQLGAPFRYDFKVNSELNSSAHPHQYRLSPEDSLAVELADPGSVETGIRLAKEENSGGAFGRKLLYNCGGGLSTFHINPYGQMSVCITARAQAYDLRSGTVRDGWRDFIYKVRMQPLSSQSLCATCSISLFCKQCPGWAELEHGDPHKPVEYLCKLAQLRSQVFLKMIE